MTIGKRMLGIIVAMFICSLVLPSYWLKEAHACSCVMPGTVLEELEKSGVVFDGIVDSIELPKTDIFGGSSSADEAKYTFSVNGSWKGEVESSTTVFSAQSSISCGYEFEVGKRYVVFGMKNGDKITVSHCSATNKINDSSPELKKLGSYEIEYTIHPTDEHEPTNHEPNEPATDEQTTDESAINEPNEPVTDEQITDEQITDESATNEQNERKTREIVRNELSKSTESKHFAQSAQSNQISIKTLSLTIVCLFILIIVGLLLYRMKKRK